MRKLLVSVAAVLVVCGSAVPAGADGFFTPFIGYNFGGDSSNCASLTNCQEKRTNFGVSFGSTGAAVGFEEDLGYAKNFFGEAAGVDTSVFTAMSNLLIGSHAGSVQPYVVGGVGLIRPHVSLGQNLVGTDKNALGYDMGFGLNIMFGGHAGVRGDVRRFKTFSDLSLPLFTSSEKLEFWRASVGLALKF